MKKYFKIFAVFIIFAFASSCENEESFVPENEELKLTDVNIVVAQSRGDSSQSKVDIDRPLTVLSFIDEIEITASHSGAIDGSYYSASETYSMVDDGSGEDDFVLRDVALGSNDFFASADTYTKQSDLSYGFVSGSQISDMNNLMGEMRSRAPNTTFFGEVNEVLVTEEGNNMVSFEMEASSGRLMTLIALSEEMVSTFNSNYVVVKALLTKSDGSTELRVAQFDATNYSKILRFYWSDREQTSTGSSVEFSFLVCDRFPNVTNEFSASFEIKTGESLGCMLVVDENSVIKDVSNFNFSFNWEETECDPCDFVGSELSPEEDVSYYTEYVYGMCESPAGSFVNVTPYVYLTDYNTMYSRGIYIDGVRTDIIEMYNGSSDTISIAFDYGNGEVLSISIEPGDMILWKAVSGQPLPSGQWTSSNGDVLTQWNTGYIPGDSICE